MTTMEDLRELTAQGITHKDLAKLNEIGVEWVSETKTRKGYFRTIAKNRMQPSYAQARHRLKFSELSSSGYNQKGVEEQPDGRVIATHAASIGRSLKGTGRPEPKLSIKEKLLRLLITKGQTHG